MACYTFRATNRVYSFYLLTVVIFNNIIFCFRVVVSRLRKFGQLVACLGRNEEETDTTLRRPVMCCLEEAETNLVARRNEVNQSIHYSKIGEVPVLHID